MAPSSAFDGSRPGAGLTSTETTNLPAAILAAKSLRSASGVGSPARAPPRPPGPRSAGRPPRAGRRACARTSPSSGRARAWCRSSRRSSWRRAGWCGARTRRSTPASPCRGGARRRCAAGRRWAARRAAAPPPRMRSAMARASCGPSPQFTPMHVRAPVAQRGGDLLRRRAVGHRLARVEGHRGDDGHARARPGGRRRWRSGSPRGGGRSRARAGRRRPPRGRRPARRRWRPPGRARPGLATPGTRPVGPIEPATHTSSPAALRARRAPARL